VGPRRKSSAPIFAITGVVQKVSNLILSLNIYLRDAQTGRSRHLDERGFSRHTGRILAAHRELSAAKTGCWRLTTGFRNSVYARQPRGVPAQVVGHEGGNGIVLWS